MAKTDFESLKQEYTRLIHTVQIRPTWQDSIDRVSRLIIANKSRYQTITNATGVPWEMIGAIHSLEASLSFTTHLHNGDPLKRNGIPSKTRLVPKGRGPFDSWEESAIDALKLKKLELVTDWSDERIAYELERYNGFGYRNYHPNTLSPYLWSGTTHYSRGKYVADGKWSSQARSAQIGAWPLIKRIRELDLTKKEVIVASRKGTWFSRVQRAIMATLVSIASFDYWGFANQYWDKLTATLGNNKLLTAFLVGGGLFLILQVLKNMIFSEYTKGDYTPSGLKIPAADDEGDTQ